MYRRTVGTTSTIPRPPSSATSGQQKQHRELRHPPRASSNALLPLILGITCMVILVVVGVVVQHNTSDGFHPISRIETSTIPYISEAPRRRPLFKLKNLDKEENRCEDRLLNRLMLDKSVALGTKFTCDRQREAGNFDYQFDWTNGENLDDDMEVRQAGALWGISLMLHDMMDTATPSQLEQPATIKALTQIVEHFRKGLGFYRVNSKLLIRPSGHHGKGIAQMRYLTYPGESNKHSTGTQALVVLALVDFLRAMEKDYSAAGVTRSEVDELYALLDEMLPFLVTQHSDLVSDRFVAWDSLVDGRQAATNMWYGGSEATDEAMVSWWKERNRYDGFFHQNFNQAGKRSGSASPYFDGESLLAITKTVKYLGSKYTHLWPFATGCAVGLYDLHVAEALEEDDDSDDLKGFYQWSSMIYFELATVTFGEGTMSEFDLPMAVKKTYKAKRFGKWLLDLAMWMIDVHEVLRRGKNTGYAFEGIVPAWAWAAHVGEGEEDAKRARHIQCAIEQGMSRLIGWQVGMGVEKLHEDVVWDGKRGFGGVQNSAKETGLRIDTTQHQMHATIQTRRLLYPVPEGVSWPWEDFEY